MKFSAYSIPGITDTKEAFFIKTCSIFEQDPVKVRTNNKNRKREYVDIRNVTIALFRMFLKNPTGDDRMSYAEAGAYFEKDHATAMHSCKTVKNLYDTDKIFRNKVSGLFKGQTPEFDKMG